MIIDTINELKQKKLALELEIRQSIQASVDAFNDETGMSVEGIVVDFAETTRINDVDRKYKMSNVAVELTKL